MKERIFTTKEQGRVLIEAGLPILIISMIFYEIYNYGVRC